MTYSPSIPKDTDNPSDSQPLIKDNFTVIDTYYGTGGDHVPFTASSNRGKHKLVTWIDQTSNLPINPTGSEMIAFSQTKSGITMPYYVRDTIGSGTTIFPMAPIKAYASFFTLAAPGAIVALDSFNIDTINQATASRIDVTMLNACRTTSYGIIVVNSNNARSLGFGITSTTLFEINTNIAWVAGVTINVIVLET